MKVTFIQHMASNGPGMIAEVLRSYNAEISIINAAYDDLTRFDFTTPDLLVVLGGSPGVYQQQDYPFLSQEIKIIEERMAAQKPYLGICLGAQLLAAALGSKVYQGQNGSEIGWYDIALTEEGHKSYARHFDKAHTKVMQWHGDTFDLPQGATLLASSDQYPNQIFSYKDFALGFQPHIEVTDKIVADWLVEGAGFFNDRRDLLHKIQGDTSKAYPPMKKATGLFAEEWLQQIYRKQE